MQKSEAPKGPVKWHKFCGRYHGTRENCNLIAVERKAKSGRTVTRLAHVGRE